MTRAIHVGYPGGLDVAKVNEQRHIDEAAGEARARYITTEPGQAETYLAKYKAAQEYMSLQIESPWLTQEAEALGLDVMQVALIIIDAHTHWELKGAEIEAARMQGKAAVKQAKTPRAAVDIANAACDKLLEL